MSPTKAQLKEFHIGYFPPYEKYYIAGPGYVYLNSSGSFGDVYYYGKEEAAKKALTGFRRKAK
jgi:hypothetical protein